MTTKNTTRLNRALKASQLSGEKTAMSELVRFMMLFMCLYDVRAAWKCCPGAVCFNDEPPFDVFPLPQCIEDIQPTMRVFTRLNPDKAQNITRHHIPSVLDGHKLTIFFVPGATKEKFPPWIYDLKDAALMQGDYNVIVVDYEERSTNVSGPQLFADSRAVGKEIGIVAANILKRTKSDRSKLYCVGHSLGAHVCGYAGITTKFGRITGLDPAGMPLEEMDWTIGLNPMCADLVDNIHTNGYAPDVYAGTMTRLGHVDFYPNGGMHQPACGTDLRCEHMIAIDLYLESITTPCFLSRYECANQYILPNSCKVHNEPIQSMGFNSNKYTAHGIFYLTTESSKPLCSH